MPASTPALALTDVSLYTRTQRCLLSHVNLSVAHGQLHVLLGPNGAGKSSLLNVASGLQVPHFGNVMLNGAKITQQHAEQLAAQRAVLPQLEHVAFALQVHEMVMLGCQLSRQQSSAEQTRIPSPAKLAMQAMQQVDVLHLQERVYHTLSGGEQQRVQLARVLAQQTDCVLLDEPLSALDIAHQHTIMQLLASLAAQGKAILVVLHDINIALRYATHITLLHQGSVHAQGAPDAVITEAALKTVYGIDAQVTSHPTTRKIQVQVI